VARVSARRASRACARRSRCRAGARHRPRCNRASRLSSARSAPSRFRALRFVFLVEPRSLREVVDRGKFARRAWRAATRHVAYFSVTKTRLYIGLPDPRFMMREQVSKFAALRKRQRWGLFLGETVASPRFGGGGVAFLSRVFTYA